MGVEESAMRCTKTGFQAYYAPDGKWLYGDAFRSESGFLFRVCQVSDDPVLDKVHFLLTSYDIWFDQDKTSGEQNSTLLVSPGDLVVYDYHGVDLATFMVESGIRRQRADVPPAEETRS